MNQGLKYRRIIFYKDYFEQFFIEQSENVKAKIFCFFGKGQLVVLANAFQKKKQKTPKKEIAKALKIKEEYENENH